MKTTTPTPSKNPLLWKFLKDGFKSAYGNCVWKVGEWKKESVAIKCQKGFHASTRIIDALSYVQGPILAQVEVRGICDKEDDKQCWTEMRLVKAYKWTAQDSVKLAIYSTELVIDFFEKKYPEDKCPRQAIDAAKAYLANPTKDAAYAAYAAAYAARAAYAAYADAACAAAAADAAYAAYAAAYAARAAEAAYAADAACAAAAADAAADAAARAARAADAADAKNTLEKIEDWLVAHVKELEEIK